MPLVRVFTTCRFCLREPHAGMRRSNRSSATSIDVSLQLPGDLSDLVRLDDVAFLDVVEVLDPDAALEALGHLAHVILEALERPDTAVIDDDAVADDARPPVPNDRAADHVTTGDHADAGNPEQSAHLCGPELGLPLLGREHPRECRADVVDRVVDHAV